MIGVTSPKAATPDRDQDPQDLLGRVGRGRDDVRGEHGQSGGLAQPLGRLPLGGDRGPEEGVLEPVRSVSGRYSATGDADAPRVRAASGATSGPRAESTVGGRGWSTPDYSASAPPAASGSHIACTTRSASPSRALAVSRGALRCCPDRPRRRVAWCRCTLSSSDVGGSGLGWPYAWSSTGHRCPILDKNPRAFRRLPPGWPGSTVVGSGFDRDAPRPAGAEQASALAAVTSGDNSNILTARIARENYGIHSVVARIYDPRRAEIYQRSASPPWPP